jgi:REP element-mobilizing transposase RayT
MSYDPHKHHRRSIRLKGYDYTRDGYYFVTICVQNRQCVLGEVVNGEMILSPYGQIVADTWLWLAAQYGYVLLGEWVIMPNHLHGIIILADDPVGAVREPPLRKTAPTTTKRKPLGRLIGAFKTVSTKEINKHRDTPGVRFWQRDFYERIIRNEREYQAIQTYIRNNPITWQEDKLHPDAPPNKFNRV